MRKESILNKLAFVGLVIFVIFVLLFAWCYEYYGRR